MATMDQRELRARPAKDFEVPAMLDEAMFLLEMSGARRALVESGGDGCPLVDRLDSLVERFRLIQF